MSGGWSSRLRQRESPAAVPPARTGKGRTKCPRVWGETARPAVLIGRELWTAVGSSVDRAPHGLLSAQEGIARRPNARPRPRLWPGTRVRRAPEQASGRFRLLGHMRRGGQLGCVHRNGHMHSNIWKLFHSISEPFNWWILYCFDSLINLYHSENCLESEWIQRCFWMSILSSSSCKVKVCSLFKFVPTCILIREKNIQ